VPQDLAHLLERRPAHDQVRGGRVPEVVEAEVLDPGLRERGVEGPADLPPRAGITLVEEESRALGGVRLQRDQRGVDGAVDPSFRTFR
jgi:hypothetical protein